MKTVFRDLDAQQDSMVLGDSDKPLKLHIYHLGMRHRLDKSGIPHDWRENDRFLVHVGDDDALFTVFRLCKTSEEDVAISLRDLGYGQFLARGTITAEEKRLNFIQPNSTELCKQLLRRMADDTEFLRYYKSFSVSAPNGQDLGITETYWCETR